MNNINLDEYKLKEIKHEHNKDLDILINELLKVINDRTIPEERKVDVKNQYKEVIKMYQMTMKTTVVVEKK